MFNGEYSASICRIEIIDPTQQNQLTQERYTGSLHSFQFGSVNSIVEFAGNRLSQLLGTFDIGFTDTLYTRTENIGKC